MARRPGDRYDSIGRQGLVEFLINKVSDFGENRLAQFYGQQASPDWTSQVLFKVFNDSSWEIGVPTKQSQ
jgi:hypothetical protein